MGLQGVGAQFKSKLGVTLLGAEDLGLRVCQKGWGWEDRMAWVLGVEDLCKQDY